MKLFASPFGRSLVLGCCASLVCLAVSAQDALVKAENLVRLQSIPLSKVMTFEQAYPPELLDVAAWLGLRALDSSSAWNPKTIGWNFYRVNFRIDMEEKQRQRWQAATATVRSLTQNPDTSLAKAWADGLSQGELDELLAFYQSETGRKFSRYQGDLRRALYRGRLVIERFKFDPGLTSSTPSVDELRRLWLSKIALPHESATRAYGFHAQALQLLFPTTPSTDLVFDLAAGAIPGSPAMLRLDNALSDSEREIVSAFLKSTASTKMLAITKSWQQSINKTKDLLPLLIGDIRSLLDLIANWKRTRSEPESLPRSIAAIDPEAINIPDTLTLGLLEDGGVARLKNCLPSLGESSIQSMEKFIRDKGFNGASRSTVSRSDSAIHITRGQYDVCIPTTVSGFPVLGLDSFAGSVSVVGMSEQESRDWYRRIAQEIAAAGSSDSLLKTSNGNAFEVTFAIDARSPTQLIYKTKFMLAGTFEPGNYRTVMSPTTFKSLSTLSTAGADGIPRHRKSIVSTPEDVKRAAEDLKRGAS